MFLKQSTAVDVLIGPFVDKTDGATAETGESPAVKLSKNGQALAAKSDVTTPVSDADGYYNCELDATDTATVGTLVLTVLASASALPVRHEFDVVEEAVYDSMYGASAAGPNTTTPPTVQQIEDEVWNAAQSAHVTANSMGAIATELALIDTATMRGTDSAYTGTPPTVQQIEDEVWNALQSAHVGADSMGVIASEIAAIPTTMVGTDNAALASVVTETRMSELDAATGGKMANQVDEIRTDTGEIGTAGAGLSNIDLPNQTMDIVGNITGNLSGSVGSVTAEVTADVTKLSGSATAADNLEASALGIVVNTTKAGTLSNTECSTNINSAGLDPDHFIGRTIIFTSGVLKDQASNIVDFVLTNSVITFSTMTDAPGASDTFVIL